MVSSAGSSTMLHQLFVSAGWRLDEVPGGWRARDAETGTTVLAFLEGGLPAGFQRFAAPTGARTWVLFGKAPPAHDRDRVELTGARVVLPEGVATTVLSLLRGGSAPGESPRELTVPSDSKGPEWDEGWAATGSELDQAGSSGDDAGSPVESPTLAPNPHGEGPGPSGGTDPHIVPMVEPSATRSADSERPAGAEPSREPPGHVGREAEAGAEGHPSASPPTALGPHRRAEESSEWLPPLPEEPSPFPPEVFETDRIVRARLHEEDIHQMATRRWRGGSPRLVLIPFFLFAYALAEDAGALSAPPRLVAVPAVGGSPQFWPSGEREIVSALPQPHFRLRKRIGRERARHAAVEAVREQHARDEEKVEQRRGMVIIEHHRRPRDENEVRVGPPALVWVPHWLVEAWNGREVIDAVTGLAVEISIDPGEYEA